MWFYRDCSENIATSIVLKFYSRLGKKYRIIIRTLQLQLLKPVFY